MDRRQRPSACPGLTTPLPRFSDPLSIWHTGSTSYCLWCLPAGSQHRMPISRRPPIMQWRRTSPGTWANLITSKFLRRVSGAGSATERTGRGVETLPRTLQISG